jgi:hypothetical protein
MTKANALVPINRFKHLGRIFFGLSVCLCLRYEALGQVPVKVLNSPFTITYAYKLTNAADAAHSDESLQQKRQQYDYMVEHGQMTREEADRTLSSLSKVFQETAPPETGETTLSYDGKWLLAKSKWSTGLLVTLTDGKVAYRFGSERGQQLYVDQPSLYTETDGRVPLLPIDLPYFKYIRDAEPQTTKDSALKCETQSVKGTRYRELPFTWSAQKSQKNAGPTVRGHLLETHKFLQARA